MLFDGQKRQGMYAKNDRWLRLKHLDLFSGIGGFALAAQWAGFETVGFCEINEWARKLLSQNFPNIPIHDDIKTMKGGNYGTIDLLTGGFPCQPYSVSGKQRGKNDERDCLPDMLRIIEESRPRWVISENSYNFLNMEFNEIKTFLEAIGYEVGEPLIIPACAVNADHRRKRAWICAYSNEGRLQGGGEKEVQGSTALQKQSSRVFESERSRRCISKPRMLRSYNGLPYGVDRIKGLGNAIVPQVAYNIIKSIVDIEKDNLREVSCQE